jgi:hypothetical protein
MLHNIRVEVVGGTRVELSVCTCLPLCLCTVLLHHHLRKGPARRGHTVRMQREESAGNQS